MASGVAETTNPCYGVCECRRKKDIKILSVPARSSGFPGRPRQMREHGTNQYGAQCKATSFDFLPRVSVAFSF